MKPNDPDRMELCPVCHGTNEGTDGPPCPKCDNAGEVPGKKLKLQWCALCMGWREHGTWQHRTEDAKWLDPECLSSGCQSRVLIEALERETQKVQKAIELLQWMHDNCLAPDITAHDAVNTCRICRLIAELKTPNDKAQR